MRCAFETGLSDALRQDGTHLTATRNVPNLLNASIDNDFLNKQNSGVFN